MTYKWKLTIDALTAEFVTFGRIASETSARIARSAWEKAGEPHTLTLTIEEEEDA